MSASLNFENTKGDTFEAVAFHLKINDVDVNLTGAVIKMQLRKSYCDTTAALSLTSVASAGITITNAAAGQFKINKQIINIDVKNYVYDIQITFADGTVKTYIKGNFNILNEVTI
jgi:hypothetical protein